MMKKLILLLFTVVLMPCALQSLAAEPDCGTTNGTADKHSEAYISQRIDAIYKTKGIDRDKAFCSQRYYALMLEAVQYSNEMGFVLYDFDHWVCGQDIDDDWSCKVVKVYVLSDSTALADLVVHNFSDIETTIALRFERDDWYIDDFSPSEDGNDDQQYLRNTILEGKAMRERAKVLVGYWGWVGDNCPELLLRLEMTDNGLEVTECNIYRMYGFDKATASFNGTDLSVYEGDYDEEAMKLNHEFHFDAHLDENGDLVGNCYIQHPLASKEYDGPLTLRKDYFKYRDSAK